MDRSFYRKLLGIALPIAFQNMISYSVNMMDTLMLGSFGETTLSAVSLTGQVFFMFSLLIGGIASGSSVLCSQYYGKKDMKKLREVVAIALKISVGISVLFAVSLLLCPGLFMRIFTPEKEVVRLGTVYFRAVAPSYLFYGITTIFLIALRSVQDVKLSLYIYVISLVINVGCNYVFIFGKAGMPKLGIAGAALGTVIARGSEVLMVLYYLKRKEKVLQFKLVMAGWFNKRLFRDLMRYGLPVMAGEFLWGLGTSVHCAILGHMGASAVAANSICNVLHQFAMSLVQGMGSASAVVIGAYIGAGMRTEAKKAGWALVRIYTACGIVTGGLMIAVSGPFFSFYDLHAGTLVLAKQFMLVYAVITVFRSIAGPTLCGIFWGSGDTAFSAKVDMGFLWGLVPFGLIAAFVFHLNPAVVLLILRLEAPFKMIVALYHLKGDKWMKLVARQ